MDRLKLSLIDPTVLDGPTTFTTGSSCRQLLLLPSANVAGEGRSSDAVERMRLLAELRELETRALLAEEKRRSSLGRLEADLIAMAAVARARLDAMDTAHLDALEAIRASAEAEAHALLSDARRPEAGATRRDRQDGP